MNTCPHAEIVRSIFSSLLYNMYFLQIWWINCYGGGICASMFSCVDWLPANTNGRKRVSLSGMWIVFGFADFLCAVYMTVTGDVALWLAHRNSNLKTLGSIPWWGSTVFLSLWVNYCADSFVPDPPLCVQHAPKCVRMLLKDPIHTYVMKEYSRPQLMIWKHENTAHSGKKAQ